MRATPLTRIARVLHLAVAALTVGLLTGFPIAVESMIQWNPTVSAVTLNNVPAQVPAAETRDRSVETLVVVRHAEKPAEGLGLLTCKGLNRALLLPDFFTANLSVPTTSLHPTQR